MENNWPEKYFASYPVVYAVGNEYQIIVSTTNKEETILRCKVGDREFFDHSNGIVRSKGHSHKIRIPMELLDAAGEYTLIVQALPERLPYFTKPGPEEYYTFSFRPVKEDREKYHFFLLSDSHDDTVSSVKTALSCGPLDFLILNGDIHSHSGDPALFAAIHIIAGNITKGEIPAVYVRGNHDLRGAYAELLTENTPNRYGNSYFTFRLGPIWGLALDCGEDKPESHEAYGGTNCCHVFRKEETEFIKEVIRKKESEYMAEGVKYRFVVCHVTFSEAHKEPFNIEHDTYREWCSLIRENIKPLAFLHGHEHKEYINFPGSERDFLNAGCPCIVGGIPYNYQTEASYRGVELTLTQESLSVHFTGGGEEGEKAVLPLHS